MPLFSPPNLADGVENQKRPFTPVIMNIGKRCPTQGRSRLGAENPNSAVWVVLFVEGVSVLRKIKGHHCRREIRDK